MGYISKIKTPDNQTYEILSNKVGLVDVGSPSLPIYISSGTPTEISSYIVSVTYSNLKTLRDNGNLIPGTSYRITDYETRLGSSSTYQSAGNKFDIIVFAESANKLSEDARAIRNANDNNYFANSKLESWQLKYCLDYDSNRFGSAFNNSNSRGVIYYMKDEFDNECYYDFKNIMFKPGEKTEPGTVADVYYYTFSYATGTNDATVNDHSLSGYCYGNKIGKYISSNKISLSSNVFRNIASTSLCYNNVIGNGSSGNTFGNYCYRNTFGNYCSNNVIGNNFRTNIVGNNFSSNTFGNNCYSNTFGNYCYGNIFGNYIKYIDVFGWAQYLNITGGASTSSYIQNAQILSGVQGTGASNKLTVSFAENKSYAQFAAIDTSGGLKIWAATDIVKKSGDTMTGALILHDHPNASSPVKQAATKGYVDDAITALPEPMVFKGSVGTSGTVEWANLPSAASGNSGWTYKVITTHDTTPICKVGDTIISDGSTWIVIPSGDEPSGTVTSVAATGDTVISISGSPITTGGTLSITHVDSGATAGSYGDSSAQTPGYGGTFKVPYVTVDAKGHVTAISDHNVTIPSAGYWANLSVSTSQTYNTQPEFKEVKINGLSSGTTASTSNCVMQYDNTNKCVKFVFN